MRKSCLECVLKHLGSAAVYIEECQMGYPDYFGYVYGQLDHAASECFEEIPDLAWTIREHRIRWAETRRSEHPHVIPFEAMFAYLDTVEEIGDVVEIPSGVFAGLRLGRNGKPEFSFDTRPDDGEMQIPVPPNPAPPDPQADVSVRTGNATLYPNPFKDAKSRVLKDPDDVGDFFVKPKMPPDVKK